MVLKGYRALRLGSRLGLAFEPEFAPQLSQLPLGSAWELEF